MLKGIHWAPVQGQVKSQWFQQKMGLNDQIWWCTSEIPSAQEMEGGEFQCEASLGKITKPYMKNILKAKGLGQGGGHSSAGKELLQGHEFNLQYCKKKKCPLSH
jgi:hypothetical protein